MKDLGLPSKRAKVYQDVPDEKWNDWRWQLSHRLNTVEDFEKVFPLTESEKKHCNPITCFAWISLPIMYLSSIQMIQTTRYAGR